MIFFILGKFSPFWVLVYYFGTWEYVCHNCGLEVALNSFGFPMVIGNGN